MKSRIYHVECNADKLCAALRRVGYTAYVERIDGCDRVITNATRLAINMTDRQAYAIRL